MGTPAPFFCKPKSAQKIKPINLKKKCLSRSKSTRITQISLKIRTRLSGCLKETKKHIPSSYHSKDNGVGVGAGQMDKGLTEQDGEKGTYVQGTCQTLMCSLRRGGEKWIIPCS